MYMYRDTVNMQVYAHQQSSGVAFEVFDVVRLQVQQQDIPGMLACLFIDSHHILRTGIHLQVPTPLKPVHNTL